MPTSLPLEDRRTHERDLVLAYHETLQRHGVVDYQAEECWADYCIGMVQAPLLTTLGAVFSTTTERGDEMSLTMLERSCAAIRDLRTLALIDAHEP